MPEQEQISTCWLCPTIGKIVKWFVGDKEEEETAETPK